MGYIRFFGGVGDVTGANFMLEAGGARILVDCGLKQGDRFAAAQNCEAFLYNPHEAHVLLVTHAHADHIGRIPKLVRDGFSGPIFSTHPTKDLAAVMLDDAYKVMRFEEEQYGTPRCYEREDIEATLRLWQGRGYHEPIELPGNMSATFSNAGHILGSAMVTVRRGDRSFLFTGDIGNVPQPLVDVPEPQQGYNYLIIESVYGDRVHEGVSKRTELLKEHVARTIARKGTLIIPAFSLERTQAMLFELNNLIESGALPPIPVFLDSPLAIAVTDIYRTHTSYLKQSVVEQIEGGDDIFMFPHLTFTRTERASAEIHERHGPKVIIAGSGMSHGGRILAHERRYLEDPATTLLLVGYQAVGSIGRLLADGARNVSILGERVRVRATIAQIHGYSGHADRDQLIEFVANGGEQAERVFVTMGEERSALFLTQRLRDYLGLRATAPDLGDEFEIDF